MKMQLSDITDRATILKIKQAHGLPVHEELAMCMKEAEKVDQDMFDELLAINLEMWDIEAQIGKLYLKLKGLTDKRSKSKNRITKKYGGHEEHKKY